MTKKQYTMTNLQQFKDTSSPICGIYKITSPSSKVYIGQAKDILKRWKFYKTLNCKSQTILYYSLIKYGAELHTFEIIEECKFSELNERERHWQDFYNVTNGGLNCVLIKSKKYWLDA